MTQWEIDGKKHALPTIVTNITCCNCKTLPQYTQRTRVHNARDYSSIYKIKNVSAIMKTFCNLECGAITEEKESASLYCFSQCVWPCSQRLKATSLFIMQIALATFIDHFNRHYWVGLKSCLSRECVWIQALTATVKLHWIEPHQKKKKKKLHKR